MSGWRTPSFRLSRTTTCGAPPSCRKARSCSSAQICVLDDLVNKRTGCLRRRSSDSMNQGLAELYDGSVVKSLPAADDPNRACI